MIQAAAVPAKRSRKICRSFSASNVRSSTSKLCPMNKKKQAGENSQERATFVKATWQTEQEAGMFMTLEVMEEHVINNATQAQGLLPTEILLDNAANISVMNPSLLKSVRPAGKRIRVKGYRW